jgi:hypothetical protein
LRAATAAAACRTDSFLTLPPPLQVLGTTSDASREGISAALSEGLLRAASMLSRVLAHALLAWCLLAPLLALLLAMALQAGLQRRARAAAGSQGSLASPPVSPPASPEPTPRRRKGGAGVAPAAAVEDALSVRASPRIAARRYAA